MEIQNDEKMKIKFLNKKYLTYLPSKKFTIILSIIIVLAVIIFVLFFKPSKKESVAMGEIKNNTALKIENQTINDLIALDSDGDGVPDWEETLWGTDKNKKATFDGMPDTTYIENKKKALNIEQSVNVNKLTETDKFAREFFTSFSAMKTSGTDPNTINGFSNALGQKIANPILIDVYTETDIKIDNSDTSNDLGTKLKYYEGIQKLFTTYKSAGIGDELDIVNKGLANGTTNTPTSYNKLPLIATAYQNFAKKIMDLSVPSSLTTFHLQIANSANNTGISVQNMSQMINDPLVGLEGLTQYQKYSDSLVKAVADLETALTQ